MTSVLDLWEKLHRLFTGDEDDFPEIDITNIAQAALHEYMHDLVLRSRECTSSFLRAGTRSPIQMASPQAALNGLLRGEIIGALWLDLPPIPTLGFFIDSPQSLSLSYPLGARWHPVAVIGLFELLRHLRYLSPQTQISLDRQFFSAKQHDLFNSTFQDFMNEKAR